MDASTLRLRRRFQFYAGADDLPLLEAAVREYGTVQAAVLAALRTQAAARLAKQETSPAPNAAGASRESAPGRRQARAKQASRGEAVQARQSTATVELYTPEAGRALGCTAEAVRSRIERGVLNGRRDENGRWIVQLERDQVRGSGIEFDARGAALATGLRPGTIKQRCKQGRYARAHNDGAGWRIPAADLLQ